MKQIKINPKVWIALAVAAIILCAILVVTIWDRSTLPGRLTAAIKEHVVSKDIFSESKLISYSQENLINLNGDGEIKSIFQLSADEVQSLISLNPLIACSPEESCTYDASSASGDEKIYKSYATTKNEVSYAIYVDVSKNQVRWSVTWY